MAISGKELSKRQLQKKRQIREARLLIVSELWQKGWSMKKIAEEVQRRLQLEKEPPKSTIKNDKDYLTAQWKEENMRNVTELVQLELARIDTLIAELFEAWEKSKEDATRYKAEKEECEIAGKDDDGKAKKTKLPIVKTKQKQEQVLGQGNVAYIAEIRQQLAERRKLLGLYQPEKKEVTGADGAPLHPRNIAVDLNELTDDELEVLYNISKKRDNKEQE